MSGTPPGSPEVEEGSPFGGAECNDSSPEPAQQATEHHDQGDENDFPFVNVSVELYEGPEDDGNVKDSKQNNEASNDAGAISTEVENVETTPDLNLHMDDDDARDDVPDSTGPDMNTNSIDNNSDVYDTTVIKSELPDYQNLQKTYISDFLYSNTSSFDEGSNSNFDDSREEQKGSALSRFPKIVKAVERAEYEVLQVLFQVLYQRSAWDTQEVLAHGILEFSGFNFSANSEDFFNREMLLRSQQDEMLAKIGLLLGLDSQVQKMLTDLQKARPGLISGIMFFLSRPSKRTRTIKPESEELKLPAGTKKLPTKCGCRNNCVQQFTKFEINRLIEYSKQLDEKNLLESYLVNLMECKKIAKANENSRKLKEVSYNYMVKFDAKEINVCKGGFIILHGIKLGRVSQLQNRVKTGLKLPKKMEMKDFPPIINDDERKGFKSSSSASYKSEENSAPRKLNQINKADLSYVQDNAYLISSVITTPKPLIYDNNISDESSNYLKTHTPIDNNTVQAPGSTNLLPLEQDTPSISMDPTIPKSFYPEGNTSRKRKCEPQNWKRNKAAQLRERGEAYSSYSGKVIPSKMPKLGMLCNDVCPLQCNLKFNKEQREKIFEEFYKLNVNDKNALLYNCISKVNVHRQRKEAKKHRSSSYIYSVKNESESVRVCKTALTAIFNVSRGKIDHIQKFIKAGHNAPPPDSRGKHMNRPHATAAEVVEYIESHIRSFLCGESLARERCRLSLKKKYDLYLDDISAKGLPEKFKVQECTYRHIFNSKFNLSFDNSQKDACSTHELGNVDGGYISKYHQIFKTQKFDRALPKQNSEVIFQAVDLSNPSKTCD